MKNGLTPKEFAYGIAIQALSDSIKLAKTSGYGHLTQSDTYKAIAQMEKLIEQLANKAKLDYTI